MMRRYKPVGWRNEPHRHALAAKGVSTKRRASMQDASHLAARGISTKYMAVKANSPMSLSRFLEEAKNPDVQEEQETQLDYFAIADQNQTAERDEFYASKGMISGMFSNEEGQREKEMLKQQDIQQMRAHTVKKLTNAVENGELDAKKREQFVEDVLANLNKQYENGVLDAEQYRRQVKSDLNRFMQVHSRKLNVFDVGRQERNRA